MKYRVDWESRIHGGHRETGFFTRDEAEAFVSQLESENTNIPVMISECPNEIFVLEYNHGEDRYDEKLLRRDDLRYDEWAILTIPLDDYQGSFENGDVFLKYGNGGLAKVRRVRMWVPGHEKSFVEWKHSRQNNTLISESSAPLDDNGYLQLGGAFEWECAALLRNSAIITGETTGLVIELEYFIGSQVGEIVNAGTNTDISISEIDISGNAWLEGLPSDIYDDYLIDPEPENGKHNALAKKARRERDRMLSESDNFVLPDRPGGTGQPRETDWKEYRKQLRDVPKQSGFPEKINWPKPPYN